VRELRRGEVGNRNRVRGQVHARGRGRGGRPGGLMSSAPAPARFAREAGPCGEARRATLGRYSGGRSRYSGGGSRSAGSRSATRSSGLGRGETPPPAPRRRGGLAAGRSRLGDRPLEPPVVAARGDGEGAGEQADQHTRRGPRAASRRRCPSPASISRQNDCAIVRAAPSPANAPGTLDEVP
jgi:hypothetical protein